mgnify:CR=1 FL=1
MDFNKSDNTIIRIEKREWNGRQFYDLRTYYYSKNVGFKPTPKGFTIPIELFVDFVRELNEFYDKEFPKLKI